MFQFFLFLVFRSGRSKHKFLSRKFSFVLVDWLAGCCCSQLVHLVQLQNKILCSARRSQIIIAALIFLFIIRPVAVAVVGGVSGVDGHVSGGTLS